MNHPSLAFGFQFTSDGSSPTVATSLSTGPVVYYLPSGATQPSLNESFSVSATSVTGMTCDGNLTVTNTTLLLGVLTVTLSGTQTAGQVYTVQGTMLF